MHLTTLVYPVRVHQIFLATILEGEDQGLYGGFLGEYHTGDVVAEVPAARIFRQTGTELNLKDPLALERVAIVNYYRGDESDSICHVFYARSWQGEMRASERTGKPEPFDLWKLPLNQMSRKQSDWLRRVVEGDRAEWNVFCDTDNKFQRCVRVRDFVLRAPRPPY